MAATVTNSTISLPNDKYFHAVHLTNLYNDAVETNVVKIDKSTLTGPDLTEPSTLSIAYVRWAIQGHTYVKLSWDHDTDVTAMMLSGNGFDDFREFGGKADTGTGGTGDLLLTTIGGSATATYDITIVVYKVD